MKFIDILPKIGSLVQQKRLTELLELFEFLGYSNEETLSLLSYLHGKEVSK